MDSKTAEGTLVVDVRSEYCVDCGGCIIGCSKGARDYNDDTDAFMADLRAGKKMSIVFAPAFKTNYTNWPHYLGYFKQHNVNKIYDTSFGAEITTWAYLKHITASGKNGWISQPCPVVVNFIEKYEPNLIPYLMPVHSPAMCTAIYMRKYQNINDDLVFLSPCFGKKSEFERYGNLGFKYNVTFKSLADYFIKHKISWTSSPQAHPDSPPGELGSFYPMPGGLKQNVLHFTDNKAWVRQIEGVEHLADYLRGYGSRIKANKPLPLLIDALNCLHGCNGGTGIDHKIAADDVDFAAHQIRVTGVTNKINAPNKYHHFENFNKALKFEDFTCSYEAKPLVIRKVNKDEINSVFEQMLKTTKRSREIDCQACGYKSCAEMAEMVCHGINIIDNCAHYLKEFARQEAAKLESLEAERAMRAEALSSGAQGIAASIDVMRGNSQKQAHAIEALLEEMEMISREAGDLNTIISDIGQNMKRYSLLTNTIINVSDQTNILSINAGIEAARAGPHGKGFAVVAEEVRALAAKSKESARSSVAINESVNPLLLQMAEISESFIAVVEQARATISEISEEVQVNVQQAEEIQSLSESIVAEAH
jgi:Na+-translocating ferredoxin:NAD+ oxidoreductase RNF subunit RnfB